MVRAAANRRRRVHRRRSRALLLYQIQLGLVGAAIALLGQPSVASAKYITLNGSSNLSVLRSADSITVSGAYALRNSGDEPAKQTFVSLTLGTWALVTDPVEIAPNETKNFAINETFPVTHMTCDGTALDLCGGTQLPAIGKFPLRITYHYEEAHGHRFSAVATETVEIGPVSTKQKHATQLPPVQVALDVTSSGNDRHTARVTVANLSDQPQTLSIALLTARELPTDKRPVRILVPPTGRSTETFEITNQGGLVGSTYIVKAIVQGAVEDARFALSANSVVKLVPGASSSPAFVILGTIAALVLLTGTFGLIVIRRRRSVPVKPSPTGPS